MDIRMKFSAVRQRKSAQLMSESRSIVDSEYLSRSERHLGVAWGLTASSPSSGFEEPSRSRESE
jgi:hypothetical protein